MCGRYSLAVTTEALTEHFDLKKNIVMKPRYNISPQENVPVLKNLGELEFLHWGFIPAFKAANPLEPGFINIRAETVDEKPSFKQAFLKRRCLVPATGYYEWKKIGRAKQPYYIKKKETPLFALAGLWEQESFGILTVAAHAILSPIHHRMPVILPVESYVQWMNHKTPIECVKSLLLHHATEKLEVYPVSPKMNFAGFESPVCIQSL